MKKFTKLLPALAFMLIFLMVPLQTVSAISEPTSGPTIEEVHIYRHCLEADDMLVVVQYHLDYTTNPSETINRAFFGRFMSADSVELRNVAPYPYYDKGYDHGIYSMYLSASEASGYWGTACSAEFVGNPMLNWQDSSASSAMLGAIADDGGSMTGETTEANQATTNDMTLLPTTPAVNDAYYFGDDKPFSKLNVNISTSGEGVWSVVWEYWDGSEWTPLSGVTDYTVHFRAAPGNRNVVFTLPSNWALKEIETINAYWIRARVFDYTSVTTPPRGAQSWTNVAATPPYTTTTTLNWHATTSSAATKLLMSSNIIMIANSLSNYWGIALTAESASGSQLSSYGEQYFTNAIVNLRTMCPSIFAGGIEAPLFEEEEFTQSYRDALLGRFDDTMTGRAFQGLSDWTTIPLTVVKGVLWFIFVGIIAYYMSLAVKDMRPALFLVLFTLPLGNLMGMLTLTVTMIAALFCILALGYAIFYRHASG